MTDAHSDGSFLGSSFDARIDALCDVFESAWKVGDRPRIEELLAGFEESARPAALQELLRLEFELRSDQGETFSRGEYRQRFSEHEAVVDEVFASRDSGQQETIAHTPSQAGSGLHVRCPHCHNPIELVAEAKLTSIDCPSCGHGFTISGDRALTDGEPLETEFAHFELIERLGIGAFGSVWKANDTKLDRIVAVKIPRKGQLTPKETESFLREARAAAQLKHPNIVSVHEIGREDERLFIVSDFVAGGSLADRLENGPIASHEAALLCAQIAEALEHAHQQGVIHRDLKPANILLDEHGNAQIADFGLAKREAGEIAMTMEGQLIGTPAYMSPEQAMGEGHRAGARSDIYSLGVVLFQLLTGEMPFRGNVRMLLKQVLEDEPPQPRQLNSNIPKDLETICLKCMEKYAGRRYDTAHELAADLQRFLRDEPIRARPISSVERGWRWCKRKPVVAGLGAAVAALLLFVGISGPVVALRESALRGTAEEQRAQAIKSRHEAEAASDQAQRLAAAERTARQAAELTERRLRDAQDVNEKTIYARTISLAQQEWEAANIVQCEDLLDATDSSLREWEWDYLKQLCHLELSTLSGLTITPRRFAFHKDGNHLAAMVFDEPRVVVWELKSGEMVNEQPFHGWGISRDGSTAIGNPTGKGQLALRDIGLILSGRVGLANDSIGRLSVFDVLTGKVISHIAGHDGGILFPQFSTDGTRLATTGKDGYLRVWDTKTGQQIVEIETSGSADKPMTLSPNGTHVCWMTDAGVLVIHDAETGQKLLEISDPILSHKWQWPAFNHDASLLACPVAHSIALWDVASGRRKIVMHGHRSRVLKAEFSPTEPVLASWALDNTARLWDVDNGRELLRIAANQRRDFSTRGNQFPEIAFNVDGSRLATGGSDATVRIWDVHAGDSIPKSTSTGHLDNVDTVDTIQPQASSLRLQYRQDLDWLYGHSGDVLDLHLSSDETWLATASNDGTIKIWDLATKSMLQDFKEHAKSTSAVRFSPNKRLVASASGGWDNSDPGVILLWDSESGQIQQELKGHASPVTQLRFTPDGSRIISSCGHQSYQLGEVMVWDVSTGQLLRKLEEISGAVKGLDVSPDGLTVATCGWNGKTNLWDIGTGDMLGTFGSANEPYAAVAFSPTGKTLAAAGMQWNVALYDVATADLIWDRSAHAGPVQDISFAGENRIVSCSLDGTARLLDARTGDSMLKLTDFSHGVFRARLSARGKYLVCSGNDTLVSLRKITGAHGKVTSDPTGLPVNSEWDVLYEDSFERADLGDSWSAIFGNWKIENGAARGTYGEEPPSSFAATLAAAFEIPKQVEVEYDLWAPQPIVCESVFYDEKTSNSLHALHVGRPGLWFNDGETGFVGIAHTNAIGFRPIKKRQLEFLIDGNKKHHIRTVRGQRRFRMYFDEQLVLETTQFTGMTLPQLRIHGSHGKRGDVIYIDNVVVRGRPRTVDGGGTVEAGLSQID